MKYLFFPLAFLALLASSSNAEVVNVADYCIVPGKDVSLEVNQLIASLEGQDDVTLFFPTGQYEFYPENAVEEFRAVTNHDNSLKRMAFPLFGLEGWTIDGDGSTFMFHGRICPITLESCQGTTLKNFSIDWDTPFHHEFTVVERDPETNSFVVEISPTKYGYEIKDGELLLNHYDWQDRIGQNITFDPATNAPIWNTKDYGLRVKSTTSVTHAGENRVRLQGATKAPPPVGSVLATYGNAPTNRLAQAIHIANSSDTYIENVTVYAAGGMALIAERCNNVHLNGFVVTSTEERTMATRADATHFLGCKGLVRLENCLLEHMLDDGINVHGAYIKIEEHVGDNTFLCEISHRQQWGLTFAEPGDQVMITSRETVLPIFETTVTDVDILNEQRMLITVANLPEVMPDGLLSMENLTWYPDVVMKNNIIRDNRARSALITTKGKVLIEDNYFSSQMHGILIEGDNNSWYESGGVEDVVITNNTFENIGYSNDERYPLYASPLLRPEQYLGDRKYHRNIQFTNNRIRSFNGHVVYARSLEGLTVAGNTIELSTDYPTGSDRASIELEYCEGVTIEGNQFTRFDWPIRIESSEDTEDLKLRSNPGLSVLAGE
jgi:hypothetical protein